MQRLVATLVLLVGCGGDSRPLADAAADAPRSDAPLVTDAGAMDALPIDDARDDVGRDEGHDAGSPDAVPPDAGAPDNGAPDAPVDAAPDGGGDAGCAMPHGCPALARPTVAWRAPLAGGPAYVGGAAMDAAGGVVIGGTIAGPTDFGAGRVRPTGSRTMFLARYDARGALAWARLFPGSVTDVELNGVAVEPGGGVVVAGWGGGTIDFGAGPTAPPAAPGLRPGFVARFTPAGVVQWARRYAMLSVDGVAVGSDGTIASLGTFNGTVDVGTGPQRSGAGGADVLAFALDAAGSARWARVLGEPDRVDSGGAIAAGPAGAVYVGGQFVGSTTGADAGTWLVRLDATGAPSMPAAPAIRAVAVDPAGVAYVVGRGSPTFPDGARRTAWVARFAADGAFGWSDDRMGPLRVAVDRDRVFVTGSWSGPSVGLRPDPCAYSTTESGTWLLEIDATRARRAFGALVGTADGALTARGGRVVMAGNSFGTRVLGCDGAQMAEFDEPFAVAVTP